MTAAPFTGVVALDGPSGTGKSTVARRLARRLGARYLDTGAMYRAATVAVLRAGVDLDRPGRRSPTIVEAAAIDISTDPDARRPSASTASRSTPRSASAETTAAVSAVSAVPAVRAQLVAAQRELIGDGGIVVEGRDIGSVVWPTAAPKVYLTASPEARARRRAGETGADVDGRRRRHRAPRRPGQRAGRPARCARRPTPSSSTPPSSTSTRSSTGWPSWPRAPSADVRPVAARAGARVGRVGQPAGAGPRPRAR